MKLQDVNSEVKLLLTVSVACNMTSLLIIILKKPILFVGTFCKLTFAVALADSN